MDNEVQIQIAIDMYKHNNFPTISELACQSNVPYQRLLLQLRGMPFYHEKKPVNYTLDTEQAETVGQCIHQLDNTGQVPIVQRMAACANSTVSIAKM